MRLSFIKAPEPNYDYLHIWAILGNIYHEITPVIIGDQAIIYSLCP
ncbi:MAG: hypothetical protein GX898_01910 [Corynebacterium sp.]|nr:hypothetical protein [uncultured Corynebacterium sp.]NLZ57055.1 hypothetical protein [Corynebacterium sp.]